MLPAAMVDAQPQVSTLFDEVMAIPGGFADFLDSALVEQAVFRAHLAQPVARVVATGEVGVLRAARFREAIGIPGQSVESALAYRDKMVMKTFCARAGVRVARHKAIGSPSDLVGFAGVVGFPIVLKPRAGAGSIDTRLIRSEAEMWSALAALPAATVGLGMNLLAEEFINGQLYHVNGYARADGEIGLAWPASYLERGNLDSVLNEGTVAGEYLLDASDPRVGPMQAFTGQCLRALPWPAHGFAFHLELFEEDGSGDFVLCEVACRQGGGSIVDIYEFGFGIDLLDASVRLQAGLAIPPHAVVPTRMFGAVAAPVRRGILHLSSSDGPPFSWVVRHELKLKSGDRGTGPRSCVDASANFVVDGESSCHVRSRLDEVMLWRDSVATWTSEPAGTDRAVLASPPA
ncbi:MAG: hypothetical protein ABI868_13585 [Acidobacteriota bacterium]